MASFEAALAGGVAMGLASALHCGAMCSGVCGAALLMLEPSTGPQRILNLLMLQVGRITTYAALGAISAAVGSSVITPEIAVQFRTLQWAAAIAMIAMGLAMAGMVPHFASIGRGSELLSRLIERIVTPLRRWPRSAPYAIGLMWGANACPMVYGAVFTASLTGTIAHGATFMAAFGIGTIPALVAAGYGVTLIKTLSSRAPFQTVAGVVLAAIGFSSVYAPWPSLLAFCIAR